jgi:thioesterase domain-containing protein
MVINYLGGAHENQSKLIVDDDGSKWWRSGDFARVDDEGFLYLVGRADDMVKINGMRVEPGGAESALRSIVGIGAAAVLAHPTSSGGHRLVGHVCVDDVSLTPEAVKMTLASTLPSHLVPAVLVRHDELPFNNRLKLDRQALLTMPIEPWRSTPPSRSTNDTVLWIASVAQQIIGLGEIAPNDDLWEVGLDSMGAVEVCAVIASQKLGDLEPTELLAFRTAVDLERRLAMKRSMSVSPSVSLNPEGSQTPIFAIPGGGGGSFAFRSLASAIGLDQPLVVIEPVGMHCKGGIESTIDQRVRTADKEITTRLRPGDPCLIMGYSAGATVATETARALHGLGYRVHLVLLDGAPTDRIHYGYPVDWRGRRLPSRPDVGSISANTRWLKFRIRHSLRNIVDLPKALRLRLFPGKHRFTKDYYQLFGRMNRLSIRRHRLQPLDVPTTLFHITDSNSHEKCRPWLANLSVVEVGGDHHSMLLPPHVDKIAERVLMILGRGTIETA